MKGYATNIEEVALENENFRTVLHTAAHMQLVVMSLEPGQDIGEEQHDVDQFIRVEDGEGTAVIDGQDFALEEGSAVIIPAGATHNIINTSEHEPMKIYTIYAPGHHADGTVHATKEDALADET